MFRLLFVSPRIAPNTGNAIRTCAATGCELHLVEPLGFDLSEPKLRRAGLDYHDLASVTVHASLAHAWEALSPARVFAFTAQATTLFTNVGYHAGDVLMFGPEPTGLDEATLADTHITGPGGGGSGRCRTCKTDGSPCLVMTTARIMFSLSGLTGRTREHPSVIARVIRRFGGALPLRLCTSTGSA